MSAIIAVCGTNFCAFVADKRKVIFHIDGTHSTENDYTEKIFKLNEKLIFGATGKFESQEKIIAPFLTLEEIKNLTPEMAYELLM